MMSHLVNSILKAAESLPEGGLISPKEFLHLASRDAIDQALTRLTREEKLLRVGRGIYTLPVKGRFGVHPPSIKNVLEAIEATSGEVVVPTGAEEANALGLTTQVPIREIYLTTGPSSKISLGIRTVEFKHGSSWQIFLGKRPAGMAIRALVWLGREETPKALKNLHHKLPKAEWEAMLVARSSMPSWLAKAVSEVAVA